MSEEEATSALQENISKKGSNAIITRTELPPTDRNGTAKKSHASCLPRHPRVVAPVVTALLSESTAGGWNKKVTIYVDFEQGRKWRQTR